MAGADRSDLIQLALQAAQVGVWEWDVQTDQVMWTDTVSTIFGVPPRQMPHTFQAYLALLHPDDRAAVIQTMEHSRHRGKKYDVEHRLIRPDGSIRWVAGKGDVIRNDQDHAIRMVGTVIDITDRKVADERIRHLNQELQNRVQEFETLIDTVPIGIGVATDADCSFIWGNREFNRMLDCAEGSNLCKSTSDADHLPFRVLSDGQELQPDDLPMQRACRTGEKVLDQELEIVRSDGTTVCELARAVPLVNEEGTVRGCIGAFLDMTERKRTEETLKAVQKALVDSLQERERLSHNLHDSVLQSLFAIGMRIEVMQASTKLAHETREEWRAIVENLSQLMEDLRSYLSGHEPPRLAGPTLARNLAELTERMNATEAMTFRLEVDRKAAQRLSAEQAKHLFYIAGEAMTNCLRHSKGKNVLVSLRRRDEAVVLEVSDDGIGFDGNRPGEPNHGLFHMQTRAAHIGGTWRVRSEPFLATTVLVTVPTPQSSAGP